MELLNDILLIKTQQKYLQISLNNILYCISDNNYTDLYLEDGSKTKVCITLIRIEELITEHGFMRIHNSLLINKKKISSFSSRHHTIHILNNDLPISRNKFRRVLMELLKDKIPDTIYTYKVKNLLKP